MYHEIERKFLVKKMPWLWSIRKVSQERYFIQRGDLFEEGFKRNGSIFEYETKFTISPQEKSREKVVVTREEFERQKENGTRVLERDSYSISKKNPVVSIKKYKGIYKGLVLAEVEFDSVEEMEDFQPYDWMGMEVTDTPLGKDARLVDLDREGLQKVLGDLQDDLEAAKDTGNFL